MKMRERGSGRYAEERGEKEEDFSLEFFAGDGDAYTYLLTFIPRAPQSVNWEIMPSGILWMLTQSLMKRNLACEWSPCKHGIYHNEDEGREV